MEFKPVSAITLFVGKPFEISYADAMCGLRVWLDHKKIQPAAFKVATPGGPIGFELTFSTEQEALAFRRFKWLRTKVERRATDCPLAITPPSRRQHVPLCPGDPAPARGLA